MRLLPRERLIRTSDVDHADWNYDPVLAFVMRRRFALVRRLLADRVQRLLEIGFGSGIFMPELSAHCDELFGIDVHAHADEVRERLSELGIDTSLSRMSAASLRFPDRFFDVIVSVSALEFIDDIASAAYEAARVLKPQGRLIAVMPVKSRVLDSMLRALTGADPERDYGDRRERVIPALLQHFRIVKTLRFVPAYTAYAFELA